MPRPSAAPSRGSARRARSRPASAAWRRSTRRGRAATSRTAELRTRATAAVRPRTPRRRGRGTTSRFPRTSPPRAPCSSSPCPTALQCGRHAKTSHGRSSSAALRSIVARTIKIGLCGFTMSALRYPQYFQVVEVQQTFYQPPAASVIDRWRARMPPRFEFTLKAWMLITHAATSPTYRRLRRSLTRDEAAGAGGFQESAIVDEAWQVTLDATRRLRATAILFQCPASFRPTPENLGNLRGFFT